MAMNTPAHLFTYGSLMFKTVWDAVVDGHYVRREDALLSGFKRVCIRGATYPALIVGSEGDSVSGVVYENVSATDLHRLGDFEGSDYRLRSVMVSIEAGTQVNALAFVFRWTGDPRLTDRPWDPVTFGKQHLHSFDAR